MEGIHSDCDRSQTCARTDGANGFRPRTPFLYATALHADYTARFAGNQHVVLIVDVSNLFNAQPPLDCDPDTPTTFPVLNPDLGQPSRNNLAGLQVPRQIRLGVRCEFWKRIFYEFEGGVSAGHAPTPEWQPSCHPATAPRSCSRPGEHARRIGNGTGFAPSRH